MHARGRPGLSRARPGPRCRRYRWPRCLPSAARGSYPRSAPASPPRREWHRVVSTAALPASRAFPACTTGPRRPRRRTGCSTRARGAARAPTRARQTFPSRPGALTALTPLLLFWLVSSHSGRSSENAFRKVGTRFTSHTTSARIMLVATRSVLPARLPLSVRRDASVRRRRAPVTRALWGASKADKAGVPEASNALVPAQQSAALSDLPASPAEFTDQPATVPSTLPAAKKVLKARTLAEDFAASGWGKRFTLGLKWWTPMSPIVGYDGRGRRGVPPVGEHGAPVGSHRIPRGVRGGVPEQRNAGRERGVDHRVLCAVDAHILLHRHQRLRRDHLTEQDLQVRAAEHAAVVRQVRRVRGGAPVVPVPRRVDRVRRTRLVSAPRCTKTTSPQSGSVSYPSASSCWSPRFTRRPRTSRRRAREWRRRTRRARASGTAWSWRTTPSDGGKRGSGSTSFNH